jgi:beta-lactamase superfamily II metal-dependent hydrolase
MLIDAGTPRMGWWVNDYIAGLALGRTVDHMVLTHYNMDHAGGLRSILLADNMFDLADTLATIGAANAAGANRAQQVAGTAAAICNAAMGSYDGNAARAGQAANNARAAVAAGANDNQAATEGFRAANQRGGPPGVASLIQAQSPRNAVAKAGAIMAANQIALGVGGAALQAQIRTAIINTLRPGMPAVARINTDGDYAATHVIDLGDGLPTMAPGWVNAIGGSFTSNNNAMTGPHCDRDRTSPPALALGAEVLWNSGPLAMAAPAGAPAAYVVSRRSQVWQGTGNPPFQFGPALGDNDSSIGLLIRFNNFFYLTAGDLPLQEEDPLITAVRTPALCLPNAGGLWPLPASLGSFKCSHHGAATSTSQAFLITGNPTSALMSAGFNAGFEHPDEAVLNRLDNHASIEHFYMTNCNFLTPIVPASAGPAAQLVPGNKSRISGDNNQNNVAPLRDRGDMVLTVTWAMSTMAPGPGRNYQVTFYDDAPVGAGFVAENNNF